MADETLHLYHFPISYFSQLVRVALEERQLKYKETYINLLSGEQNTEKFLRINPKGQVPMLKIGDAIVPESEHILDAIDKLESSKGKSLIPDASTAEGKLVAEWRKKFCQTVEVETLTYGMLLNPELHVKEVKFGSFSPGATKEGFHGGVKQVLASLDGMKEKCPDIAECIDNKAAAYKGRLENQFHKEDVEKAVNNIDNLLGDAESQLRKSRTDNILEHWLCGSDFSVADIHLCVLLGRLDLVGLLDKHVNPETRPALVEYWTRAQQRASVEKVVVNSFSDTISHVKLQALKVVGGIAGGTAVAGAAVLLGVFIAKKYL